MSKRLAILRLNYFSFVDKVGVEIVRLCDTFNTCATNVSKNMGESMYEYLKKLKLKIEKVIDKNLAICNIGVMACIVDC